MLSESLKRSMKFRSVVLSAVLIAFIASSGYAAELKIALTQAQAGDARKYQPLLDYFSKKGMPAKFITSQDNNTTAGMFASGEVNAMFGGSGIAGTMMIKDLAYPVARPLASDGTSTYHAVIIAPKGSPKFTGSAEYFNGKRVIFSALASAGEFYFRSLGASKPAEIKKAASHGAALDALSRGQADIAVIKNHVWTKERDKFPGLEKIGEDNGENPDNTLIVSKNLDKATADRIAGMLMGIKDDSSPEASAVKSSLKAQGFISTTMDDYGHTIEMLKKAGVDKSWGFKY